MTGPKLILASASPRRSELLSQIGVKFEVAAQHIDESPRSNESPEQLVMRLSQEKAAAGLAAHAQGSVVIGSDTLVILGETIMGKPEDQADGQRMLAALSGAVHKVLTAVTVCDGKNSRTNLSSTRVKFRLITEAEASEYWQSGEPEGKAGGYGIQGLGAVFVESIEGSYSGVMGLPLFETAQLLREFGVPCWQPASK